MSTANKKYYRSLINTPGWDCIFRSSDNSIVATSCPDLPESERYEITVEIVRALNCHAELLEALQELLSVPGVASIAPGTCDIARAAIARATSSQ